MMTPWILNNRQRLWVVCKEMFVCALKKKKKFCYKGSWVQNIYYTISSSKLSLKKPLQSPLQGFLRTFKDPANNSFIIRIITLHSGFSLTPSFLPVFKGRRRRENIPIPGRLRTSGRRTEPLRPGKTAGEPPENRPPLPGPGSVPCAALCRSCSGSADRRRVDGQWTQHRGPLLDLLDAELDSPSKGGELASKWVKERGWKMSVVRRWACSWPTCTDRGEEEEARRSDARTQEVQPALFSWRNFECLKFFSNR